MRELTSEGRRAVDELAQRHGLSNSVVRMLLEALANGGGSMAQFNHPELGGPGQWTSGGMVMIGDMFNHALKARVDSVCGELARRMRTESLLTPADSGASGLPGPGGGSSGTGWPSEFGAPSASGAQGDLRYAYFHDRRRLVIQQGGRTTTYDTGEHRISGVSQQQGGGSSLTFTSQLGPVRLSELAVVGAAPPDAPPAAAADRFFAAAADPLVQIERLAELHKKGILTDEEFAAKKKDLLDRV